MRMILLSVLLAGSRVLSDEPLDQIEGTWIGSERGIVCVVKKDQSGLFSGTIVKAENAKEVGQFIFKELKSQGDSKRYQGKFIRPDDVSDVLDVAVTVESKTLKAVMKKFIFTKTFVFTKQESNVSN